MYCIYSSSKLFLSSAFGSRADEPWVSPNRVAVTQLTEQIGE